MARRKASRKKSSRKKTSRKAARKAPKRKAKRTTKRKTSRATKSSKRSSTKSRSTKRKTKLAQPARVSLKSLPKKVPDQRKSHAGKIYTGCMFLGLGIGLFVGHPGPGILIGMGVGFVIAAYIKSKC